MPLLSPDEEHMKLLVTYAQNGMINLMQTFYVTHDIKLCTLLLFCLIFCKEAETNYLGQL